jgi:hypothetical protein
VADTPAFRAELTLLQQQMTDLCGRHECRGVLVVVHPNGNLNRLSNMTEEHVKRVLSYIVDSDNSTLQPLTKPGAPS